MTDLQRVLERDFLDCRCMILELAAALDRIDRAGGASVSDARLDTLRAGLRVLASPAPDGDRAKRILDAMSVPVRPAGE